MEPLRLPDSPRFLTPLVETFGMDAIVGKLRPLLIIFRSNDHNVTVAQGAEATDNLRSLLIDLPTQLGAGTAEEFLIGYQPLSQGPLPEADAEVLRRWQEVLGRLYLLRQAPWLDYAEPGDVADIAAFRAQLLGRLRPLTRPNEPSFGWGRNHAARWRLPTRVAASRSKRRQATASGAFDRLVVTWPMAGQMTRE